LTYLWTPSTYLSNANIPNPVVSGAPPGIYTYLLHVTDLNGCGSVVNAAAVITILPPVVIFAGNDTSISINQPLHLNAIDVNNVGVTGFLWSPSSGLNNAFIPNPTAIIDHSLTYTVTATTANGCTAQDEIKITVFRGPEIYVPTAFTPNGDGTNDLLRPILVGIKSLTYFSIFNRYGEQVYSTTTMGAGWNGLYKGQMQNAGGYVWMAEAVDYKGHVIQRKGNAVLII
jgi:gliding motility-associated-like protein